MSEERDELRSIVSDLLDKRREDGWDTLRDQVGVTALAVPEEHDGARAGLGETAVVLEELGRHLTCAPLLASTIAVAALRLHGSDQQRTELLPRIAGGEVATVLVDPPLLLEPDAAVVLVPEGAGLRLADTTPEATPSLDPTLRLGRLDAPANPSPELRAIAAALTTAVQLGVARRGLDMTVAYSKERVQFGRPIGSFQALKHRMADLLVLLEMSRSASWAATDAAAAYLNDPSDSTQLLQRAGVAKAYVSDALFQIASETVQMHGGIAITWEHDAHLVLKAAHSLGQLFGSAADHRAAVQL